MIRVGAAAGPALGAIFGAALASAVAAVSLLGLDRLPVSLCGWKAFFGFPCPTCGSTRALACLAHLDLAGAFAMNPLAASAALLVACWAALDLALLPSRRAFVLELSPGPARLLRVLAPLLLVLNWLYLVAAGR